MRMRLKWASGLLLVPVLLYGGAVAYLAINEAGFIFRPADRTVAAPAPRFALRERRVTYPSTDGVTLSAWIVPSAGESDVWLLVCHGNYGNIAYGKRQEFYASMRDIGLNLFAFDYRGFGESTGIPDELGVYADATASYEYVTRRLGVPAEQVILFGHSLGSGVAIELAARKPAAGLIVEGAYTSIVDRGQELYPLFPVSLIARQRFPSFDRISSVEMPKLFLHSPEDDVIPYAHGRRLFEAARAPKRFVDVKGGHEDAYRVDRRVYFDAIAQLVREIDPVPRADSSANR